MNTLKTIKSNRAGWVARWSFITLLAVTLAFALAAAPTTERAQAVPVKVAMQAVAAQPTATQPASAVVPATEAQATTESEPVLASADMMGLSGKLRAVMGTPDVLGENPVLKPVLTESASGGGEERWPELKTPTGEAFTVVTLVPFSSAGTSKYGAYRVGKWPTGNLTSKNARYALPTGFIGVTPENQGTNVSESFRMRDFLTHDQGNVWPKVLVLRPTLLDKLELIREELHSEGLPNKLHVMSGFRTPQYNAQGVGKGGRATHSRHMYGDASDIFVDADGNGTMDDLNKDGKITRADAQVLLAAAERVEARYPQLVGGLSAYPANSAHGPFVHVDTRGFKARW